MKNFLKFKTRQNSSDLRKFGEEYYMREAKLWRPFRLFGVFATSTAMIFILSSLASSRWIHGSGFQGGLWEYCFQNMSDTVAVLSCPERKPRMLFKYNWQNAVIGLMIFAATFGFLASVLSMCGVCTNPLPRKIYYFHSAALSASIALLIFPAAIETDNTIKDHQYGVGYGLGWGGALFFLAAAVCMSLDDIVRQSSRTKCCKWCWKGKTNDRNQLRQV
ncbi:hypothetical protein Btru_033277 [Bulinus truncatus]|nr:hypothetical protein Btru_033277 [Bulinus truncatus]